MPDSSAQAIKALNWRLMTVELKKIGVHLSKEAQQNLIMGDEEEIMNLLYYLLNLERRGGTEAFV